MVAAVTGAGVGRGPVPGGGPPALPAVAADRTRQARGKRTCAAARGGGFASHGRLWSPALAGTTAGRRRGPAPARRSQPLTSASRLPQPPLPGFSPWQWTPDGGLRPFRALLNQPPGPLQPAGRTAADRALRPAEVMALAAPHPAAFRDVRAGRAYAQQAARELSGIKFRLEGILGQQGADGVRLHVLENEELTGCAAERLVVRLLRGRRGKRLVLRRRLQVLKGPAD